MKLHAPHSPTDRASRARGLAPGMTLTELLVSTAIGAIILVAVMSLLGTGASGYKKIATGGLETGNAQLSIQTLRADLELRHPSLPLSLGQGKGNGTSSLGWDFTHGLFLPWSGAVDYGSAFPAEANLNFPSDRIGFFIILPDDLADDYAGHNIAHVLYFTAITQDLDPTTGRLNSEDLTPPSSATALGYSKKLFRYFTPPDRVYHRLNHLNSLETSSSNGLRAIPRGPNFTNSSVTPDDSGFPYDPADPPSEATLSVVTEGVAEFRFTISGHLKDLTTGTSLVIQDFLKDQNKIPPMLPDTAGAEFSSQAPSLHALLSSSDALGNIQFTPTLLNFSLKLVSPSVIPSFTVEQWDLALGTDGEAIGRENVIPSHTSFTYSFTH